MDIFLKYSSILTVAVLSLHLYKEKPVYKVLTKILKKKTKTRNSTVTTE